jgi:hypothetical protein
MAGHEVINLGPTRDHGRLVEPTRALREFVRLVARAQDENPEHPVIVTPTARARMAVFVYDWPTIRYARQRSGINWATVELAVQYGFVQRSPVPCSGAPESLPYARHDLGGIHREQLRATETGRTWARVT